VNRRELLVAGAAAAAPAILARPGRARAAGRQPVGWTWNNPFENGGRANAICAANDVAHHAAVMGDTWGGPHESTDGGTFYPRMGGIQNGENGVYGRTIIPSKTEIGAFYMGVGELKTTGGEFHALLPGGVLQVRSNLGFADNAGKGAAGVMPRTGCGRLITSLIDATSGKEILYALIHDGLHESDDLGHTWTKVASDPNGGSFQKAVCAFGTTTIFCASYSGNQTSPSTFWEYVRSTKKVTVLTSPGVINDLAKQNTPQAGTRMVIAQGSTISWWNAGAVSQMFTDNSVTFASVDIVAPGLIVAITSAHAPGSSKCVIVSRDNGNTWTWATLPGGGNGGFASNVVMQSIGSPNPYPLAFAKNSLGADDFQGAMVSIDQHDSNYWYIAGTGGAWVTQDGGATFHPAGVGAGGGTGAHARFDSQTGGITVDDTDWGGWTTTNYFQTYHNNPSPGSMPGALQVRSTPLGSLDASNPGKITLGSYGDISDAYYQQAAFNVLDVQMDANNFIIATLKAGNSLIGTPH
jgi:hypothetical protein